MADYEDIKVKDLVINNMSQEKFDELKAAGELQPDQIYFTPESDGASLPDQTDNAGKMLMTDGTTASWSNLFSGNYYVNGGAILYNESSKSKIIEISEFGILNLGNKTQPVLIHGNLEPTYDAISAGYAVLGSASKPWQNLYIKYISGNNYNSRIMVPTEGGTLARLEDLEGLGGLPDQTDNAGKFLTTDGTTASWSDKPIVNNASVNGGIAIGLNSSATQASAVSIGSSAGSNYGSNLFTIAVGANAQAGSLRSIAIGGDAKVDNSYAVQIGMGTNTEHGTVCIGNKNGNFKMMDVNGNVPRERLKNLIEVLPTEDNGYVTVKNYGNGYVEITGYTAIGTVGASIGSEVQIDLPAGYTMANANYWVNIAPTSETTMFDFKAEAKARSTTHFMVAYKNEDETTGLTAAGVYWEVRGMLATA